MKHIKFYILVAVLGFLAISCNDDEKTNALIGNAYPESFGNSNINWDTVGVHHNLSLDYALNYIVQNGMPTSDTTEYLQNIILGYYNNIGFIDSSDIGSFTFPIITDTTFYDLGQTLLFSPSALNIMQKMDNYVNSYYNSTDMSIFIDSLNALYPEAQLLSDSTEYAAISCGIATAKYSGSYWMDDTNISNWEDLTPEPCGLSKEQKRLLWKDGLGAAGGAYKGVQCTIGLGIWGWAAGAMVGAMVGGSLATLEEAIEQKYINVD